MNDYLPEGYRWANPIEVALIKRGKVKAVKPLNVPVRNNGGSLTKKVAVPK